MPAIHRAHAGRDYDHLPDDHHQPNRPVRDRRERRRLRWELQQEPEPAQFIKRRKHYRADGSESFKCLHCRAFIGPTVSGGRHRNHCPLCLYSRHVDGKRPGDRAEVCRSLMAPVGVFYRPNGEQVVLHRCLGCDLERHNRVAADDNPVAILRLPLVPPRVSRAQTSVPGSEAGSPADLHTEPVVSAEDEAIA